MKTIHPYLWVILKYSTTEAEFKELSRGLNLSRSSNMGYFHLKLYSIFQDLSRRSIETGFWGI